MSELSRVEDLLKDGVEEPVLPMSELEAILRGEHVKPHSRVAELLLQYNPKDILIEKRIEENGTYYASVDNADGYFKVIVDTPVVPPVVLDHLVETITQNGEYTYTPEHDGYSDAAITVAVPTSQPVVASKNISANGTYVAADEQLDGYSSVKVEVPDIPAVLDDITITENGNYTPPSGTDGYNDITVQVPGYFKQTLSDLPSPIATFTGADAPLDSLKASIEGVQDLHGYDKPWAGGAGKNKLPLVLADIKAANTTGTWSGNTYTISNATFTVNIDDDGNVVSIIGKGNGSAGNALLLPFTLSAGSYILSSGFDEMNGTNDTFLQSNGVTIARGNSDSPGQSFTLNQDSSCNWLFRVSSVINYICTPMIRLSTESDVTFAPYSNICPISGWTECVVNKTGKNLLDVASRSISDTISVNTINLQGCTATKSGDTVTATATGSWSKLRFALDTSKLVEGQTYTASAKFDNPSGGSVGVTWFDGAWNNTNTSTETSVRVSTTFTYNAEQTTLQVGFIINNTGRATGYTVTVSEIQLEAGSSATTYEAYSGNTYTIPFKDSSDNPITVYDGDVDVVNGGGTDRTCYVDLGSLNWTNRNDDSPGVFSSADIGDYKLSDSISFACSHYNPSGTVVAISSMRNKEDGSIVFYFIGTKPTRQIYIKDTAKSSMTGEEFKAAMSGVQLVYELETPIVMQFDPIALRSNGVTNISVNCGEVTELKYFSMTGSMQEYYLTNGKVGSNVGSYVTVPLDISPMTNGVYEVVLRDEYYSIQAYEAFMWNGSTVSVNLYGSNNQSYTLQVTSTTAGLTYWSGAWRDIYADIIKVADLS